MSREVAPLTRLPIDDVLPALREALSSHASVVLQAPPGAGKSTRVPLALRDAAWLAGRRLVMLEPRRIAARAVARHMAGLLGQSVGETVGYRVRGDVRVGPRTRVEVVTEGVLTRMLVADPTLEGVGAVIFDEFHERNLVADLGLALALQAQELLRPELRILVMSATLEGAAVSALLGDAPIVHSEGRQYLVEVRHRPRRDDQRIESAVALAVRGALAHDRGSILVFLPGVAEIRRTSELLTGDAWPREVRVRSLYGDLSAADQDAAIAPAPAGERKVVLATSIAESSLTIDGVGVVIDAGLSRVPRFAARTGMMRLDTVRVSRASADQRAGRAGRTAAGVCYRLWDEAEHAALPSRSVPEILDTDLAPLALDLAAAGVTDPLALRWLDAPPPGALAAARALLLHLGALDPSGLITAHGRAMTSLGTHPRFAHMLLAATSLGFGATACVVAALLEERDLFARGGAAERDADLRTRVTAVANPGDGAPVDGGVLHRVRDQARRWRARLGVAGDFSDPNDTGRALALAYPDRVAVRRSGGGARFLLRNGTGAMLPDPGSLASADWIAIGELDGRHPESRVYLAAALQRAEVETLFAADVARTRVVAWDAVAGAVAAVERESLGAIVLRERAVRDADAVTIAESLLDAIKRGDGVRISWTEGARRVQQRILFVRSLVPGWPDVSDDALAASLDQWLAPHLVGARRRADVERLDVAALLLDMLTWEQRRDLESLAPSHVTVPTGSRIAVDYGDPLAPALFVRLQELFGLADGPRVGRDRVPLVLHLLSPARRPVQVTRDLAGFWAGSYSAVRRDLRGRYPKHPWPDDPRSAEPTRRAKPRER